MNEECDDQNNLDSDGCSKECKLEIGFKCELTPSKCKPICGDGRLFSPEFCDAGTAKGCLPDCSGSEVDFYCEGGDASSPSKCSKGFDPQTQQTVEQI